MERMIIQLGRSRVILAFIVAIGLVAGYLNYSQADDPTIGLLIDEPVVSRDNLESFKGFTVDFSILEDERYKSLEIFGENPVIPGIIGEKKNPFVPF